MYARLVTAPATEPVSVAEVMAHLRLTDGSESDYLQALIVAAREVVERAYLWRALITQTWEVRLDEWPFGDEIALPYPPLQRVERVSYLDEDGEEVVFPAEAYVVDTWSEPGRIRLQPYARWPAGELWPAGGIRIRYVAGYGDSAPAVPRPIRHAILLLVGHLYENREATGRDVAEIPMGVAALLAPYRAMRF